MAVLIVSKSNSLDGCVIVPGDKSISHRAVIIGSLAQGETRIANFLASADCLKTIDCVRKLGIEISCQDGIITVYGRGLAGLREPRDMLDVGNSGTTIRLMSGLLAGQPFGSFITGDESIRSRPMDRVTKPLKQMGAAVIGRKQDSLAPLAIRGGNLEPISYCTEVASAQVKSAILIAGLFADGWTEVTEPAVSRNHTELMLQGFGVPVITDGLSVRVKGRQTMYGCDIQVPGDMSTAAFLIAAATIVPDSKLVLKNVGLNPSRTGIIDVLQEMGGNITIDNKQIMMGELVGDITVETARLSGIKVAGDLVVRLIDEIPILAVAAAFAEGVTEIRDAAELRVKESNRIAVMVNEFSKLGIDITELPDGLRIKGGRPLTGAVCSSHGDHRIALSLAVAGLMAEGKTSIMQAESTAVSFPNFNQVLAEIGVDWSVVNSD